MIHPNLIKRKADEDGLSAPVVERDYVLAHALAAISKHDEQGQIVFKGGTALRLCHFEDYRYSADLDFSLVGGLGVDGALQLIAASCSASSAGTSMTSMSCWSSTVSMPRPFGRYSSARPATGIAIPVGSPIGSKA